MLTYFSLFFEINFEVVLGGRIWDQGARDCTQHVLRIYFFLAKKFAIAENSPIRQYQRIFKFAAVNHFIKFNRRQIPSGS